MKTSLLLCTFHHPLDKKSRRQVYEQNELALLLVAWLKRNPNIRASRELTDRKNN
jgi:GrpB-like predicted nucleotidyltransferase (UPF0157 family)